MAKTSVDVIVQRIFLVRGQKVLLDWQLAELYGVATRHLNQQVRRNRDRFPADFVLLLTHAEAESLRSQIVISKPIQAGRGGRRYLPYAFTEHGAIMAATVLNSPRAIEMSLYVVRAFVKLREVMASHKDLAKRLDELEARVVPKLDTHDQAITGLLNAIRELTDVPRKGRHGVGFTAKIE